MNDPYDGYMPEYVYERYWDWEMGRSPEDHPLDIISAGVVQKAVRQITFVNCWHMNSEESAAMWALYPNYGVAIRSTIGRLIQAFRLCPIGIIIRPVQYINFDFLKRKEASLALSSSPVFVKRRSFEHERELRAAILEPSIHKEEHPGMGVETDVAALIEKIFISPLVKAWLTEVVREELKVHDLRGVEVIHSALYSKELA